MGTGYDKKVLNYRSGRLADSASIERVSQSRAGMVSVFYNYMRNPYGTFSTGGAQQDPTSRDPKLLISKSIREIGASIVGNRMRALSMSRRTSIVKAVSEKLKVIDGTGSYKTNLLVTVC